LREEVRRISGTPGPNSGFEHDKPTLDTVRDRQFEFARDVKKGLVFDGNAGL